MTNIAKPGKTCDAAELKRLASGHWPDVLESVAGIPRELLDGRNHPCPKCGGRDRFRFIDPDAGACFCNKCFNKANGDGLAAVRWSLNCDFPTACRLVGDHLGVGGRLNGHDNNGHARRNGQHNGNGRGRIVAEYDYRDESGELLFQVCRKEPKDFLQRKPKPGGGWDWSTKGVRRVLYRLPELLAADPSEIVFIVEGEKDVDRLREMGLTATCNAGGAGTWRREYADCLRGRHVAVVADNDAEGVKHAKTVARSIHRATASVKLIELPGIPDKGDVCDWLSLGGGDAKAPDLLTLAEETDVWEPSADDPPVPVDEKPATDETRKRGPVIRCFADIESRPVSWLWKNRIATGRITLLVGRPGLGKSFLTCDIASRLSTGTPWPDGKPCQRGSTLLITAEDDAEDTIRPRLDAHRADVSHVHTMNVIRQTDENGDTEEIMFGLQHVAELEAAIQSIPDYKAGRD